MYPVRVNYFEYFSEIEERFTARRGSLLLLSTLDWALIETWREAGVPLAAVLRGIDDAFDKHEARKARAKGRLAKVNGLGWCAQAVMAAATAMAEASVGGRASEAEGKRENGFEAERVSRFLESNAAALGKVGLAGETLSAVWAESVGNTAARLRELAAEVRTGAHPALDELDRTLTVLEERLQAALRASLPETELTAAREAAERELAPYRAKMGAVQLRQVREQFVHKRLFEARGVPRLSLFYMPLEEDSHSPGEGS
ncbi:MAG TPA: hypothetical protein VKV02_07125 [Acidobacteriaceae bacterium]|nr:hypothetical protein [Acidobacteriaceae bacterium]